jgi:NAD(P)-dependent dehydrogenase (short-subunit alcohol dehydrogenase family)
MNGPRHTPAEGSVEPLRFDGRVVVVTGAGRNLGREYALLFASRGAAVVVNDLGVGISDTDGRADAPPTNPADDVVGEIRAAGGEAVASYDSVATSDGGEAIVRRALEAFGRVDVVVNNAGQVRMMPFADFSDDHIDTVIATQLRGVLNVSRPAWRAMVAQGGGRFVNVSSGAAFGSAPNGSVYGMAKMGVVGLTRAMATEGRAVGIAANVVAPYAKTRPGSGFGPFPWSDELGEWLHPRKVAPLVAWLAHDRCGASGDLYEVGAGWFAKVDLVVHDGHVDGEPTIESVAAGMAAIEDSPTRPLGASPSSMDRMMEGFAGPAA